MRGDDTSRFSDDASRIPRRRALQLLGGVGLLALAACSSDAAVSSSGSTTSTGAASTSTSRPSTASSTSTTTARSSISAIPEETAGPYPGDGSNGVNVLNQDGVVRSDIRSSFGTASGVAQGVPVTVTFTVYDTSQGGAPLPDAAVYAWHCDREGRYSLYTQGATNENYLRGVQPTDSNGAATFTTIYPACYAGRWPHIHFEVYRSVNDATSGGSKLATSQIALPGDVSSLVYATEGYSQSVTNLAQVSLATDMVFSDGVQLETPTVTGSVDQGYNVSLKVGV